MADAWSSYRELVVSADAPAVQVSECRRAFYAGAQALFGSVMTGLSTEDETTPADMALMETIAAELFTFGEMVKAGRA